MASEITGIPSLKISVEILLSTYPFCFVIVYYPRKLEQIRRRVGQMFMIGFDGKNVTDDLKKFIQQYYVGGVVLFERNIESPEQITELTNEIQSLSKTPLFIAVDQEGGRVARLKAPFTDFGSADQIAKKDSPKLTFEAYQAMAKELRAVGINFNLAPVLDVRTNPENKVIGDRSYSSDPQIVSKIASGAVRGLQRGNVIACAKHFPGHGDTLEDSHVELPKVEHSIERLREIEWVPFEKVIKGGVESVMTAHILNPKLDPELPATLSSKTIEYLRNELRFQKIIISDDMEMDAIAKHFSIEDATLKAIEADLDIIMICKTAEKQVKGIEYILRKVLDIKLPLKRIELSSERITKVRNHYLVPYKPVDPALISNIIGCDEHLAIARALSA